MNAQQSLCNKIWTNFLSGLNVAMINFPMCMIFASAAGIDFSRGVLSGILSYNLL